MLRTEGRVRKELEGGDLRFLCTVGDRARQCSTVAVWTQRGPSSLNWQGDRPWFLSTLRARSRPLLPQVSNVIPDADRLHPEQSYQLWWYCRLQHDS